MKSLIILGLLFFCVSTTRASTVPEKVTVTAFTLTKKECGGYTKHTALMTKPRVGKTAAVSRDLIHLLGHSVYIEGAGLWKLESVSKKGLKNSIDLLVHNKRIAMKIGRSQRRWAVL